MGSIKSAFLAVCLCMPILPTATAGADGAGSADELAQKVQAAVSANDTAAISALYNWEGVPEEIADQLKDAVEVLAGDPVLKVEVRPLPADFPMVQELGDQKFVQNVDLEGVVVLIYTEDGSATGTMPYGSKDGTYYFSAPVPE